MTNGEKNFIESKDTLYYNFPTNCLLHGTLLIFCAAEILLYFIKYEYHFIKGSVFGLIIAIAIASLDIINMFVRLCLRKKYQHAYYGVCIVLISLYLHYFAIKVGLYPFNHLYGFLAVGIWVIFFISLIYAIIDNVKNDRYNDDSEDIYFFKDQTDKSGKYFFQTQEDVSEVEGKKFGIVITWHTKISGLIYLVLAISLAVPYYIDKNLFNPSGSIRNDFTQGPLILIILIFSYITNFGWKFIVKQFYMNKTLKN